MVHTLRRFLLIEAIAFIAASLVHSGVAVRGYEHEKARTAEGVIALVLLAGLAWTALRPERTRRAALAAQGFALAGTLVGLFTIAMGIGPRTAPDLTFHALITIVLAWGLVVAARARPGTVAPAGDPHGR